MNTTSNIADDDRPVVLVRGAEWRREEIQGPLSRHFQIQFAESESQYDALISALGSKVDAVVTNGASGLFKNQMQQLSGLKIVHCRGAGTENIDVEFAKSRGIVVTTGAGANAFAVADQAMALLLASVRSIIELDAAARSMSFNHSSASPLTTLHGKRLGIAGLGHIGKLIAKRAEGFNMAVGYCSRSPRNEDPYTYIPDLMDLARWCEFLIVTLPGGADTKGAIDAKVLQALGPAGFLINVSRGSVVDTNSLLEALNEGAIRGAAIDVWEAEPAVDDRLASAPNLILSPHVGGFAAEASSATYDRTLSSLLDFFAGRPVSHRLV